MLGVPWIDKAIRTNWDRIVGAAQPDGLPLPISGDVEWKFQEFGCGVYGCVLPTESDAVVLKITSDPTEAAFVHTAMPLGWPDGIVQYYMLAPLDFKYRGRAVYAIWREAAFDVGGLVRQHSDGYEARSKGEFLRYLAAFKYHAASFRNVLFHSRDRDKLWAQAKQLEEWAWNNIGLEDAEGEQHYDRPPTYGMIERQRGAYRLAASLRACEIIAEMLENTYLADAVGRALSFYLEHGMLLADVHAGNIGRVSREGYTLWVITDPGHAVFLP